MKKLILKISKVIVRILGIAIILFILLFLGNEIRTTGKVDFGGKVKEISLIEDGTRKFVLSNFSGMDEHCEEIIADEKTKVFTFSGQKITIDDIEIDDYVDGDYRIFSKETAGRFRVAQRDHN